MDTNAPNLLEPLDGRRRRWSGANLASACLLAAAATLGPWELPNAQAAPGPSAEAAPEPSDEQIAAARELFREGLELEKNGNWEDALATFQKVAAVKLSPQVRYHVALCHDNLGQLVEALNGYELAAHEAKLAGKAGLDVAKNAPARIAAIQSRVGHVRISVIGRVRTSKVLLDGRAVALALLDSDIPLDPGDHVVQVETGGEMVTRQPLRIEKGKSIALELEINDPEPPPPPVATATTARPSGPPPPPPDDGPGQLPAYLVGATGLLLVAGGAVFWGLRESTIAEVRDECGANDANCNPAMKDTAALGETYTLLGRIFFPVGGTAVATGVILWFVLAPDDGATTDQAAVRLLPTPGGAELVGRF